MKTKNINREELLALHLQGLTYRELQQRWPDVSRQWLNHLLIPGRDAREVIWERTQRRCQSCGVPIGVGGQYHQPEGDEVCAQGPRRLTTVEYLCPSCHYRAHAALVQKYLVNP